MQKNTMYLACFRYISVVHFLFAERCTSITKNSTKSTSRLAQALYLRLHRQLPYQSCSSSTVSTTMAMVSLRCYRSASSCCKPFLCGRCHRLQCGSKHPDRPCPPRNHNNSSPLCSTSSTLCLMLGSPFWATLCALCTLCARKMLLSIRLWQITKKPKKMVFKDQSGSLFQHAVVIGSQRSIHWRSRETKQATKSEKRRNCSESKQTGVAGQKRKAQAKACHE
jgi:hypothetical protein